MPESKKKTVLCISLVLSSPPCTLLKASSSSRDSGNVWGLCLFPRVTETNDHKLCDLKQHMCMLSWFWRSEVQNQRVDRSRPSIKALGVNLVYACLLVFDVAGYPYGPLTLQLHCSHLSPSSHAVLPACQSAFSSDAHAGHMGLGVTLVRYDLILVWVYLQGPYFQVKSHSPILKVRISTYLLEGIQFIDLMESASTWASSYFAERRKEGGRKRKEKTEFFIRYTW